MDTKISDLFWTDPAIVELPDPDFRLAALWLMTNSTVNLAGYGQAHTRRFAFETGLASDALAKTFDALPKTFERFGQFGYWIRNYIRRQIGADGTPRLSKNKLSIALVRDVQGVGDPMLIRRVVDVYPSLKSLFLADALALPSTSPCHGPEQSRAEQSRAEQSRAEQSGKGTGENQQPDPAAAELEAAWVRCQQVFGRKIGAPSYRAASALTEVQINGGLPVPAEWDLLAAFVSATAGCVETRNQWHPRETAHTLAENLGDELDKARQWAKESGWKGPTLQVMKAPAPEGWQDAFRGHWPHMDVPASWDDCPELARKKILKGPPPAQPPEATAL